MQAGALDGSSLGLRTRFHPAWAVVHVEHCRLAAGWWDYRILSISGTLQHPSTSTDLSFRCLAIHPYGEELIHADGHCSIARLTFSIDDAPYCRWSGRDQGE